MSAHVSVVMRLVGQVTIRSLSFAAQLDRNVLFIGDRHIRSSMYKSVPFVCVNGDGILHTTYVTILYYCCSVYRYINYKLQLLGQDNKKYKRAKRQGFPCERMHIVLYGQIMCIHPNSYGIYNLQILYCGSIPHTHILALFSIQAYSQYVYIRVLHGYLYNFHYLQFCTYTEWIGDHSSIQQYRGHIVYVCIFHIFP